MEHNKLYLREYYPKVFDKIFFILKYNRKDLYESLSSIENFKKISMLSSQSGGQSGAIVFSTYDDKFIIKTISRVEKNQFLKQMLKKYKQRIINDPNSKLARILGVFKIYPFKYYFMIMECVICQQDESIIFDLKGSEHNRFVDGIIDPQNPPTGKVLKDVNFKEYGKRISLEILEKNELIKSLKSDILFLKQSGIMDYSLLLVFYLGKNFPINRYTYVTTEGFFISIGIIDIFQRYNLCKASEKTIKSFFSRKDISSTDPGTYAERFLKFINTKVFIQ